MRALRLLMVLAAAILLAGTRLVAQDQRAGSGRIAGRVLDSAGAVLPGVKVTLSGADITTRDVISDASGRFVFDDVKPHVGYVLRTQLTGFSSAPELDIAVTAGETLTVDL